MSALIPQIFHCHFTLHFPVFSKKPLRWEEVRERAILSSKRATSHILQLRNHYLDER